MFSYGKQPNAARDQFAKVTGRLMGRRFQPGPRPDVAGFFQLPPLPVPSTDMQASDPAAFFQMRQPQGKVR